MPVKKQKGFLGVLSFLANDFFLSQVPIGSRRFPLEIHFVLLPAVDDAASV